MTDNINSYENMFFGIIMCITLIIENVKLLILHSYFLKNNDVTSLIISIKIWNDCNVCS